MESFVFICELLWTPQNDWNNTNIEYNLDENSDSEGYKNEDKRDNESVVPDSDPDSSDTEVLSVGLVKFLVIILI